MKKRKKNGNWRNTSPRNIPRFNRNTIIIAYLNVHLKRHVQKRFSKLFYVYLFKCFAVFLPEIIKSNVFTFQKIYNLFERHTHAASLYVSKDCARLSFIHQSVSNESCSARKNVTCGTSSSTFKILFTTFCFILTTFSDTLSPNNSYFDFG